MYRFMVVLQEWSLPRDQGAEELSQKPNSSEIVQFRDTHHRTTK